MHIISNEISTKNRLVMGEVTHKIIYMLVPLNFIHVEQTSLSKLQHALTYGLLTRSNTCIQLIKWGW